MTTDRTRYLNGLIERIAALHFKYNKETDSTIKEEYGETIESLKKEVISTINKHYQTA